MSATDMIYKIIDEKCLKQSAVARAAGYDPKKFNALLRGRKRLTSDDSGALWADCRGSERDIFCSNSIFKRH